MRKETQRNALNSIFEGWPMGYIYLGRCPGRLFRSFQYFPSSGDNSGWAAGRYRGSIIY